MHGGPVRARPVVKTQFGFNIKVDSIDSEYMLGDLEVREREIRARLQREGLLDPTRQLLAPWDYKLFLMAAPEGGAAWRFRSEASRLQALSLCRFVYVHNRFQGDGAAEEIRQAFCLPWLGWMRARKAVTRCPTHNHPLSGERLTTWPGWTFTLWCARWSLLRDE